MNPSTCLCFAVLLLLLGQTARAFSLRPWRDKSSSSSSAQLLPVAPRLPGIEYSRFIGIMKGVQKDAASTILQVAEYCRQQDLPGVRLDLGPLLGKLDFVIDPTLVDFCMQDKTSHNKNGMQGFKEGVFYKSDLDRRGVGLLTGKGVLLSDGPDHTRKRRLILPSMNERGNLQTFLEIMQDVSLEYTNQLKNQCSSMSSSSSSSSSVQVNVGELMSSIAMKIVGLCLFSQNVVDGSIYKDISVCLEHVVYITRHPLALPRWVPSRRNRRFNKSIRRLDDLVYSFIDDGKKDMVSSEKKDLLGMLLSATYEDSSAKLTNRELRDEVMTLFLAGHETTAISLSWALWFLSDPQNEHWQDKIAQEYWSIFSTQEENSSGQKQYTPAIVEDVDALRNTRAVLCETLRLRTPSYAVDRQVQVDLEAPGGILLKKGAIVLLSPMAMHLNPDHFPDPHKFDPLRFIDYKREAGQDLWDGPFNRSIYMPFGSGRKRCLGYKFAQWESLVILGTLLSQFRVRRPPGVTTVAWEAGVTLRPDRGLELVFEPRDTNQDASPRCEQKESAALK